MDSNFTGIICYLRTKTSITKRITLVQPDAKLFNHVFKISFRLKFSKVWQTES